MNAGRLFIFGFGFCAEALARPLLAEGWRVAGTTRSPDKAARMRALGVAVFPFDRPTPLADPEAALAGTTHLLASVPPDPAGEPVLDAHAAHIAAARIGWIGYLSTTGVYGDRGGAWVDETAEPAPSSERSARRVQAEAGWRALGAHVFRLPGIYGPGRSAVDQLRAGTAKRIDKPGQVFSRIHVEDVAGAVRASMARPDPGAVYNVADDAPAASHEVVAHAAELLGLPPPPLVPHAEAGLSAMGREFYADSRRVSNAKLKRELGWRPRYPDYRAGLAAIVRGG